MKKAAVYTRERGVRILKESVTLAQYQEKYPGAFRVEIPSEEQMADWVCDSVCEAIDGCPVEPDGTCQHGYPSWLLAIGLM